MADERSGRPRAAGRHCCGAAHRRPRAGRARARDDARAPAASSCCWCHQSGSRPRASATIRPLVPLPSPDDDAGTGTGPNAAAELVLHRLFGRVDLGPAVRLRQAALARVEAVQGYASARGCRRSHLLAHFGEMLSTECGGCDRCRIAPLSPRSSATKCR
ncbi:MAG: hypothetical protein EXR95_05460 [Gemmatimonadetes bacterium]|nr:hypothetical protein [Gemmatimonadota bacterium]